jgi:uncharacterized protein (TIGR03067 family)
MNTYPLFSFILLAWLLVPTMSFPDDKLQTDPKLRIKEFEVEKNSIKQKADSLILASRDKLIMTLISLEDGYRKNGKDEAGVIKRRIEAIRSGKIDSEGLPADAAKVIEEYEEDAATIKEKAEEDTDKLFEQLTLHKEKLRMAGYDEAADVIKEYLTPREDAKNELKKFQGSWTKVGWGDAATGEGTPIKRDPTRGGGWFVAVKGDRLSVVYKNKFIDKEMGSTASFKVVPNKNPDKPGSIELTWNRGPEKGKAVRKTVSGIYKFYNDDYLMICWSESDFAKPTEFTQPPMSGRALVELKR